MQIENNVCGSTWSDQLFPHCNDYAHMGGLSHAPLAMFMAYEAFSDVPIRNVDAMLL